MGHFTFIICSAVIFGVFIAPFMAIYREDILNLCDEMTILTYPALEATSNLVNYYLHAILGELTPSNSNAEKLFTKDELKTFKYRYLAIVGEVFDVAASERGIRHYGQEGHYNFFTGVDGTKAFVSGDFTEKGLTDDISDLAASDVQSIEDWRLMYHKDYSYVGKVIGRFYDSNGKETDEKIRYRKSLDEAAKKKLAEKEFNKLYPPCNSEFNSKASRLWCTTLSGGIQRSWVGVPRKLFTPGTGHFRCACVRTTGPPSSDLKSKNHNNRGDLDNPNLREYDNCEATSISCSI